MIPETGKSKDWDTTENLYIEGDNLDALKILKETYAGKVKLIYIDPPYNTGHDFVYDDDFAKTRGEYDAESGEYDEEGRSPGCQHRGQRPVSFGLVLDDVPKTAVSA